MRGGGRVQGGQIAQMNSEPTARVMLVGDGGDVGEGGLGLIEI